MTQTHSIISNKLEQIQKAIKDEDLEIQKLETVEHILEGILEGGDTEIAPTPETPASGQAGEKRGRQDTLREIILHTVADAGRPITIPEIEAAVRSVRGKAVRKQGIYSTTSEMANKREIRRVKPGLYRAAAGKN